MNYKSAAQRKPRFPDRAFGGIWYTPTTGIWKSVCCNMVPFNEGWGQFRTGYIAKLVNKLESTRLVDIPSGWPDRGVGAIHDIHSYPGPDMPPTEEDRSAVLGEFGGQVLVAKGHLWISDFSQARDHYKTSQSKERLHSTYDSLIKSLFPLK